MATNNPFQTLRGSRRDMVKSYSWYMAQIKKLGISRMRPSKLMRSEIGALTNKLTVGGMYLFMYDPKLKDSLPVYDTFPLVLPFRKIPNGFLGLNLHYLPYLMRAQLLTKLYKLANNDLHHPNMKLRLSWDLINATANHTMAKACVHRYLTKHLRSYFLEINPVDWRAAVFLPVESFKKMTKEEVFRQTRRDTNG